MKFDPKGGDLTMATDLRRVHKLSLNMKPPGWIDTDPSLLEEANIVDGAFLKPLQLFLSIQTIHR